MAEEEPSDSGLARRVAKLESQMQEYQEDQGSRLEKVESRLDSYATSSNPGSYVVVQPKEWETEFDSLMEVLDKREVRYEMMGLACLKIPESEVSENDEICGIKVVRADFEKLMNDDRFVDTYGRIRGRQLGFPDVEDLK